MAAISIPPGVVVIMLASTAAAVARMAVIGVPPGNIVIALAFAATAAAASTFKEVGVEVHNIIGSD
jgi:hypothetical protein